MIVCKRAIVGTLESNDAMVAIEPGNGGIDIEIESVVMRQFGSHIRGTVKEMLDRMGITDVKVSVRDRGALDLVLRARMEAAVRRATETAQ